MNLKQMLIKREMLDLEGPPDQTTDHTVQFVLGGDNHVYSRENLITIN